MTLEEAITKRKSVRSYKEGEVTPEEILKLLWAASRTPSAGAVRALKIYEVRDVEKKKELCIACLNQKSVEQAAIDLVIAVNYEPVLKRYGKRGYRYALMEAGHMGQNISLMAVELGLGTVMIGTFSDGRVKEVMGIPEDPLYVIPIGRIDAVSQT